MVRIIYTYKNAYGNKITRSEFLNTTKDEAEKIFIQKCDKGECESFAVIDDKQKGANDESDSM